MPKGAKTKAAKSAEDTILELEQRIQELKDDTQQKDASAQIEKLEKERTGLQKEMYSNLIEKHFTIDKTLKKSADHWST